MIKRMERFPYILNAGKKKDDLTPVCYYPDLDQAILGVVTLVPDTYTYFELLYMPQEDDSIKELILSNCEEDNE